MTLALPARRTLVAALTLAVVSGSAPASALPLGAVPFGTGLAEGPTGTWIVQTDPGTAQDVIDDLRGLGLGTSHEFDEVMEGFSLEATDAQIRALADLDDVLRVEAAVPTAISSSSETTTQRRPTWGLDRIDQVGLPLDGGFTYASSAGAGVRVYVVDTGVDPTHPDFTGRVTAGYSAIGDGVGADDCHGHGTHVAGSAASATYGVAKGATIVPVRVLGCDGRGDSSHVVAGANWILANHPAGTPGVVNMSLGGGVSSSMARAVDALTGAGLLVVAAAGNANGDACLTSPARVPAALTVGATASTDARSSFSNWGTCVDGFAPGSAITSTYPGGRYATMSGTSMAAPHAAGMAALLLQREPSLRPAALTERMLSAAHPVVADPGPGSPDVLLTTVQATPTPTAEPEPDPSADEPAPDEPAPAPGELPSAPEGLAATSVTSTSVTVAWGEPSAGADNVVGYRVQSGPAVGTWTAETVVPATARAHTLTGLTPATDVVVVVSALGPLEHAAAGEPITVRTSSLVAPGGPQTPRLTAVTTATLRVAWSPPAATADAASITGYTVQRSVDGRSWRTVTTTPARSATLTRLEAGTQHHVRVRANSAAGSSPWVAAGSAVTRARPSAPRSVRQVSRTPSSVSLTWAAPATSGDRVTDYRVEYSTNGRTWTRFRDPVTAARGVTVDALRPRTTYRVRITAIADGVTVGRSAQTTVRTSGARPSSAR
ncbi:fibronectin type III domain-containing protein [Actinotalea sp. BY-33]|uniref:Fibronectin type III domain-containing protein n=1 Tax=Actinotalea soli TaxID=2819234 RepID=A0A939LUC2_9CELL|nr:S8 family serine peptidase [Actinotalea soli]MBO1752835.1 fibronectin type III domain-containing protein [Actinotalea soli]